MKAKKILKAVMSGELEIEQSGIAHGENIINAGPYRYFGSESSGTGIHGDKEYFYTYGNAGDKFSESPDVVLPIDSVECVYLWEIE